MKELRGLERSIRLCEYFHLALITPCVSLPIAMFVKEESQAVWLLMALGTIIPVQLIRFICDRVQKKLLKAMLSLFVTALATALTIWHYYWMCYLACCIPMLISGLLLPRHKDRLIFTIPTLIALIPIVLLYALGKIYPKPLLCTVSVILAALVTLDYFLYVNQTRLLADIGTSVIGLKAEVSVSGLIRQNRKIVAGFLLAALLILTVVPLVAQPHEERRVEPLVEATGTFAPEATPEPEPEEDKTILVSPKGKPINLELLNAFPYSISFYFVAIALIGAVALIVVLINSITKQKNGQMEVEDGMTIERLKSEPSLRKKERLTGFERKIRRTYERLIKSRAPKKAKLSAMTPTELEHTAGVSGDGSEAIHDIYSRTRYGAEPATKECYTAFREAIRALSASAKTEQESSKQ